VGVVETAQQLADEVLYPAALTTDESETLPAELLDTLSAAGLYGIVGPEWAGGCEAEFLDFCAAIEALASGCLTTTFVWVQHHGAVRAAMLSENEAVRDWLTTLCRGGWRAGLALGGALPGEPRLVAREVDDGWKLDGVSPFVSGWGRIDVVLTLARTEDGRLVSLLLDARESRTLVVERLRARGAECDGDRHRLVSRSRRPRRSRHVDRAVHRGTDSTSGHPHPCRPGARRGGALLSAARAFPAR